MKLGRPQGPRDQEASTFNAILIRLCASSGALAAALVDADGESVDYAGRLEAYDVRVTAAEWRIVLSCLEATRSAALRRTSEIMIRTVRRSYAVYALSDGYALVLALPRYAFRVSRRALSEASDELEREAGLLGLAPKEKHRWSRIEVRTLRGDDRRPLAVWYDGAWRPVTILGRFQTRDLESTEAGYLVRFASGAELLVVREPLGVWFAGDPRFSEAGPV